MLEIRDVQFFPDGRSLVDTIGGKRFKVISRGQREGYNTAKVELIHDKPSENVDGRLSSVFSKLLRMLILLIGQRNWAITMTCS